MSALEIVGVIFAVILFFGFIAFMCVFIALGILQDEDPERAEESAAGFMEKYGRPSRLKSAEDEQREAEKALAEVMSTSEALEFLHISYKTLHNAVKRGELTRFEIPGKNGYFFKTADLQDFQLTLYDTSQIYCSPSNPKKTVPQTFYPRNPSLSKILPTFVN